MMTDTSALCYGNGRAEMKELIFNESAFDCWAKNLGISRMVENSFLDLNNVTETTNATQYKEQAHQQSKQMAIIVSHYAFIFFMLMNILNKSSTSTPENSLKKTIDADCK